MSYELSEKEKEQVLAAYSLYCGIAPEALNTLIQNCEYYGISFKELFQTASQELNEISFKQLYKLLNKIAVAKLVKEYTKYVNIDYHNLPDPILAYCNGKSFCPEYVITNMKELFKYKSDLLNIIDNLIERNS